MAEWQNGAAVQRCKGAKVEGRKGETVQRFNGAMVKSCRAASYL